MRMKVFAGAPMLVFAYACGAVPCEQAQACCDETVSLLAAQSIDTSTVSAVCAGIDIQDEDACGSLTQQNIAILEREQLTVPDDCL